MNDKSGSARELMLKGLALRVSEAARALDDETPKEPGVSDEQKALNGELLKAISEASVMALKSALIRGASPNARDEQQRPALIIAIKGLRFMGRRIEIFEALLSAGADPNAACAKKITALMEAATLPTGGAVKTLLAAGADAKLACSRNFTALHLAAQRQSSDVVEILIKAGSPVNKPNDLGETPLMMAAEYDRGLSVQALLSAGADVGAVDSEGATALNLCRRRNGESSNCEAILTAAMEAKALWRETQNDEKSLGEPERGPGMRI